MMLCVSCKDCRRVRLAARGLFRHVGMRGSRSGCLIVMVWFGLTAGFFQRSMRRS
jgi:hypothetical protein